LRKVSLDKAVGVQSYQGGDQNSAQNTAAT
jgi:hypothetical protein